MKEIGKFPGKYRKKMKHGVDNILTDDSYGRIIPNRNV
ncbi:MAG: hypothetical protein K0R93_3218 [Anaerosolibacter sp.]|jgi:hypothetical protein|nr:hypothetical protein [Anaerosolibacter sp.]